MKRLVAIIGPTGIGKSQLALHLARTLNGEIVSAGLKKGIIKRTGSWYKFKNKQLGQGKETTRVFLKEHPGIAEEIKEAILKE